MDFQDSPVQSKGTDKAPKSGGASDGKGRNANIMPGGKVDPRSKLYQRSVAGRETIDDAIQRMVSGGSSGRDIFNEIVSGLMSRKYGFVGAYLDSKNPGRTYNQKQAMAITYQKMADNGIDVKDKGKEGGQEQAPGPKAMPVGQQRKQGIKRPTGPALPETKYTKDEEGKLLPKEERDRIGKRGTGLTPPYQQPVAKPEGEGSVLVERRWQENLKSEIAKIKKKESNGTITSDEAQSLIRELGKKAVQAGKEERERALKGAAAVERKRADQKRERQDTAAPGGGAGAPEEEKSNLIPVTGSVKEELANLFVTGYRDGLEYEGKRIGAKPGQQVYLSQDAINAIATNAIEDLNEKYGGNLDLNAAKRVLSEQSLDKLGIDPFEGEDIGSPEEEQSPGRQPQPEQAPTQESKRPPVDRQAQANDDDVMRRATLMGGKKSQAAPEEQAAPGEQAQPEEQAAPAAPKRKPSRRGFGALVPKQSAPRGGGGITPSSKPNPEAVKEVMDVAKENPPLEDFKTFLYNKQGDLFGKTGFETGSADTNPLEGGSTQPFPKGPEETAPASQLPGSGGPTPRSAARGQEGQQSLFKMKDGQETMEPRGDLKKGSKPKPTPRQPAPRKRTQAESQQIRKMGSEALADLQTRNKLAEDMTRRISNSPIAKDEEMRDWINNDLERLLKSFTPAEKTEDPWEQDGPEPSGIPEPEAPAQQPQRALPGQPGPRGLLPPGKEPAAPRGGRTSPQGGKKEPSTGRRTKAQGDEIRRRGQETLEQLQRGQRTASRMQNSPVAQREDEVNRRGEELLGQIQNEGRKPAKPSGRRTKAQGDEIRRRGQQVLEEIQSDARTAREVQDRMANSPAGTGEAPSDPREADITKRGEDVLRGMKMDELMEQPGMTSRKAANILARGGYSSRNPLDRAAGAVLDGMDRNDAAVSRAPKAVQRVAPKFNRKKKTTESAEYQEFAQSIRSLMR